jgi:hypothetical protein
MRCLVYKINICLNVVCVVTKNNLHVNVCEEIWDTMKVGHKQAYVWFYNICIFLSHTSIAQRWLINKEWNAKKRKITWCMSFVGYEKFVVKAPKSYLNFFLKLLKALEKCQPQSPQQI